MPRPDVCDLARHLQQERLFVTSEKQLIRRLNVEVLKTAERLYQTAWITMQQRINLDRLILTSPGTSPAECCQHAKVLEQTRFADGYKGLGCQESAFGGFLSRLRESPRLVACCLAAGERLDPDRAQGVMHSAFTSLYGNCIMPEDEDYLLQVLRHLMEFKLQESGAPHRLLQGGSCAFDGLFRLFSEGLHSAKLFLTAALHEPIMRLLAEDHGHLETDPGRLAERFTPGGARGSGCGRRRLQEAAEGNRDKLAALVDQFADSLRRSAYCFPPCLRWLVSQVHRVLSPGEARAVCANLLLSRFICPAVADPQRYGIVSDAPVNEMARFNLMQVGKLLQQLAMADSDEGDSRWRSTISKLDKNCVAAFLDSVIGGRVVETLPVPSTNLLEGLSRIAVYITQNQLLTLVDFVRTVVGRGQLNENDRLALETLLADVPLSQTCSPSSKSNNCPKAASQRHSRPIVPPDGEAEASSQDSLQEVIPEEVLVISLGSVPQTVAGMMTENEVLALQQTDGTLGEAPAEEAKLLPKPDKNLRFTLSSCGPSNHSNSLSSSLDLDGESVSELGTGPVSSDGVEALELLEHEQATTRDNLDDKLRKFEIREAVGTAGGLAGDLAGGLGGDRDAAETVSETWSMDVLGSDFDPNPDEDRLQDVVGAGLMGPPGLGDSFPGPTFSDTTSEAWSVEVLPGDSEVPDRKQEERLQELESWSGVGSASDDTEVREGSPGLSAGIGAAPEDVQNKAEDQRSECGSDFGGKDHVTSPDVEETGLDISPPGAVVRPKVHQVRPAHSPSDPPIPVSCPKSRDLCFSMFAAQVLVPLEVKQVAQRHSFPERLLSDSVDVAGVARRPASDPDIVRGAQTLRLSSTPSRNSLKGEAEEGKESDEERSDRNRPWWKKRLPKAPKQAYRKKGKHEKEDTSFDRASPDESPTAPTPQTQAAEDILDKYRNIQRSSPGDGTLVASNGSPGTCGEEDCIHDSEVTQKIAADNQPDPAPQTAPPPDSAFSFSDAKKKLRLALCSADSVVCPAMVPTYTAGNRLPDPAVQEDNEIVQFLKVQLAEAVNLQDKNQMAQIRETMRCVGHLDGCTCLTLLAAIAGDYRKRAPYIAYLTRCRQGLQTAQAHLERLLLRVLRDKEVANGCFTTVCVRLLLEHMEPQMLGFIKAFQGCTAADDKTAAVEDFLRNLYGAMANNATWQHASEEQLQDAQAAIEHSVMDRIFKLAFYPNLDGDVLRDQLLQEHIQRLSRVVTANHQALQIPEVYLKEAPWPSAQAEIRTLGAYKTPRDKVRCVSRMCSAIMNLLSLANEDSVPGADDFVPVLVFVLIKANPPCLLSTIQYVNNFYSSRLSGEESYWWMQFTAAVEFIKTIDDRK